MSMISKIRYYASKAIENPELIFPFLEQKIKYPILFVIVNIQKLRLETHKMLLDDLRKNDNYLLIVLDACRHDALNEVADEFFNEPRVKPVLGGARNTFEWGKYAWNDGEYETRYLSGAAPINDLDREERRNEIMMLYDGYVPSEHMNIREVFQEIWVEGEIPPEKMTEIAIEENKEKMVVHYYQPHAPFVGEKKTEDFLDESLGDKDHTLDNKMWNKVEEGKINDEELWELYMSNLRRVLISVKELLEETNYDNIVITSDHGEALGEYGVYGHPKHVDHPKVRVVPWMRLK